MQAMPHTAAAWQDGTLSSGQVRVITANVKPRHADLYAQAEGDIVPIVAALEIHDALMYMRHWAAAAEDQIPGPDKPERPEALHVSATLDGRGEIRGSVSADSLAVIEQALRLANSNDFDVPASQRNAQAAVDIFGFFLNHHLKTTGRRNRPHLTVIVREDDNEHLVGTYLGGGPVSRSRLGQFFCDGMIGRMTMRGTEILDLGKPTETIPIPIWQAVAARDLHCRYGHCRRPAAWGECHHVVHCQTRRPHRSDQPRPAVQLPPPPPPQTRLARPTPPRRPTRHHRPRRRDHHDVSAGTQAHVVATRQHRRPRPPTRVTRRGPANERQQRASGASETTRRHGTAPDKHALVRAQRCTEGGGDRRLPDCSCLVSGPRRERRRRPPRAQR
jgi:hypothetical protein